MSTVPMPLILDLLPSPNVTIPIFPSKSVLNKALFPVMCLELPLSKYQKQESRAFKAVKVITYNYIKMLKKRLYKINK